MLKKTKTKDVLEQKIEDLNSYLTQFNNAISIVTKTVSSLGQINDGIEDKINEIDEYQKELTRTKEGLCDARVKNERVIKNFNALLNAD